MLALVQNALLLTPETMGVERGLEELAHTILGILQLLCCVVVFVFYTMQAIKRWESFRILSNQFSSSARCIHGGAAGEGEV